MLKPYLAKVLERQDLSTKEAECAMEVIMRGEASAAQIGGFLVALRMKGETVEEIVGSACAMRSHATKAPIRTTGEPLFDVVGTGGDGSHTYNISTAAAFLVAGAGRRVAKHGNRAASSRCGSADVLDALGVQIDLGPEQVAQCIDQVGIGFLFAPRFHPAMKHAIGPRRELGQRSIFNVLGPLTNPAGATHMLIGVYDGRMTRTIAEVLGALGVTAAFVVHGYGGLDELSTAGPNMVSHLQNRTVRDFQLEPGALGLRPARLEQIQGGDPQENARIMIDLLRGSDTSVRRDVLLLNAGAALAVETGDLQAGLEEARHSLQSGAALGKLEQLRDFSQRMGHPGMERAP